MNNEIKLWLAYKLGVAMTNVNEYYTKEELKTKKIKLWDLWDSMDYKTLKEISNYDIVEFEYMLETA